MAKFLVLDFFLFLVFVGVIATIVALFLYKPKKRKRGGEKNGRNK